VINIEKIKEENKNLLQIQTSLYDIATAAHTIKDSNSLYIRIHKIIAKLMYADNMYIALYNKIDETLKFEYYIDTIDKDFVSGEILKLSNKSVTAYCIKKKQSVLFTKNEMVDLTKRKVINPVGTISYYWLGVPLISKNNIVGVITVQSYDPKHTITEKDKNILSFVSELLAMSIEQKKLEWKELNYKENLEKEVEQRTRELFFAKERAEEATLAKTEFLANMSHELRTPLNAIIGYSEILIEDADDEGNDDVVSDLNKVLKSGQHLLSLINEVLDLSKIEANRLDINLSEFILQDVIIMIKDAIQPYTKINGNILNFKIPKKPIKMFSDNLKFKQILFNVLTNACKYSEKSEIIFSIKNKKIDNYNYLEIIIKDKGIGISKEELEFIFQPFIRANKEKNINIEGTGLGLAITKAYIDLLGGKISVRSKLDIGSEFKCLVPLNYHKNKQKSSNIQTIDSQSVIDKGSFNIFIVDDDIKFLDVINRKLSNMGYNVSTTNTGINILTKIKKFKPDLIILDIIMPDIDGWTLYSTIKSDKNFADVPIIIVTIGDYHKMSVDHGAEGFIKKPIAWNDLYSILIKYDLKPTGNILVIDDDYSARTLIGKMISKEGWTVKLAENGEHAFDLLKNNDIELILLDLLMPVMDGFEFLKKIKKYKKFAKIPIIVITSKDLTQSDYDILKSDVVRIVQKGSYKSDEIIKHVNKIIRNKK